MKLNDGTGKQYGVKVDKENLLHTFSVIATETRHTNYRHGESYSVIFDKTPTGAGDCFGFIKNTSDVELMITSATIRVASDEIIQFKLGDIGTAVGGTTLASINRNLNYGKTADTVIESGVDITGLSGGSIVEKLFIDGAVSSEKYKWDSGFILPKNKMISFYVTTGNIAVLMTIAMFFHDKAV